MTGDRAVAAEFARIPEPPASDPYDESVPQASAGLRLRGPDHPLTRGSRATLRVAGSPCPQLAGAQVELTRRSTTIGAATLGDRCRARFRVRATGGGSYRARINETTAYTAAQSKSVRLRVRDH